MQEVGVPFRIQGELWNMRGTLSLVLADNSASHLLGGFKSLSSALRKCRQCLATDEDVQTKVQPPTPTVKLSGKD